MSSSNLVVKPEGAKPPKIEPSILPTYDDTQVSKSETSFNSKSRTSSAQQTIANEHLFAVGRWKSNIGGPFSIDHIFGKPIDEVDPYVFDDTFCVLSKKFGRNFVFRFSASRALFIFGPMNPLRRICVFIITHQLCDLLIVAAILANCISLAFGSNKLVLRQGVYDTEDYNLPREVELTFLVIYTFEMLIKILAKGFLFNKFSYLRDKWNILDFFVVMCGFATEVIEYTRAPGAAEEPNVAILRTFRVIRVIKTVSIIPGLRTMINALLNAVVQLIEVMALTFFCLCIFTLFADEMFKGKLHQVCVVIKGSKSSQEIYGVPFEDHIEPIDPTHPDKHHLWQLWVKNTQNWATRDFPKEEFTPCSNETGGRQCPPDYICMPKLGGNPDDGWTSFDYFFNGLLSTFQLLTLDFWERLYDLVVSTTDSFSVPFFVLVVFFGSFYLLNLMLAVVAMSYEIESKSWQQKPLTKHEALAHNRTHSTFNFDDLTRLNITVMTKYVRRTPSQREMLNRTFRHSLGKHPQVMTQAHDALTAAIMDVLGKRMNLPMEQPVSANQQTSGGLQLASLHEIPQMEAEEKPEEEPARSRSVVLQAAHVLIDLEDVQTITRIAEKLMVESNQFKAAIPKGKLLKRFSLEKEDLLPSARYNNDEDSDGAISILSTDLIEDLDQYSTTSTTTESNKDRVRERKYSTIQRLLRQLKNHLSIYINHWIFEAFITLCIITNTVLLATEHHNQEDWLTETVNTGGYIFTLIFTFEAVIKIIVLQGEYFTQNWNLFDFVVVCLSFGDILVETNLPGGNAIRSFRLLRIFKLAHSWLTMKILLNIIFSTFGALGNLVLILGIVIYVFAVLGMQVIGKDYVPVRFGVSDIEDENFPRWNFQDFWYSFMMVFRVMCGEWIEPLWECLVAHEDDGEWKCFCIFLPILIIGNFIVLNLFLALLLSSFDSEELNAQRKKEKGSSRRSHNLKKVVGLVLNKRRSTLVIPDVPEVDVEIDDDERKPRKPIAGKFKMMGKKIIVQNRKNAAERAILRAEGTNEYAEARFQKNPLISAKRSSFIGGQRTPSTESMVVIPLNLKTHELYPCFPPACLKFVCFGCCYIRESRLRPWDSFRKICFSIVSHSCFEWGILILIMASSITLCFEDIYLEENANLKFTLFMLNYSLTFCFIIEMVLKWFGYGFYKYFTSFWTLLDCFIILVSLIGLIFDIEDENWKPQTNRRKLQGLAGLKALRTLRALRPLRAISRWQGMKVVVNALLYAIPSIFNVLVVCLLFWLVFAIMGVQFFKGKFFHCIYDSNGSSVHYSIIPDKAACCGRDDTSWINTTPNFDSVFEGYLSLFQVATFEGWIELMRAATDVGDGINQQTRRDNNFGAYIFFVVFIVFGSFFTLNLFIGVIIDNFNVLKKKYDGNLLDVFLTTSQKRYYTTMRKLGKQKPKRIVRRPLNALGGIFYDISMSRRFEIGVFVLIFLNMVLMGIEFYDERILIVSLFKGGNVMFSTLYTAEAIIKIIGTRWHYFTNIWNVFDFILVGLSSIDTLFADSGIIPFPPTLLRVVRVFRIGRVLRLIKGARGIRKLLFALIVSLPALFNIGALLALITFIYAILGMAFFKDAVLNTALDELFSFQTFPKSALLLFRVMTAAGWNEVLDALTTEVPDCGRFRKIKCGRGDEPPCISRIHAVPYMVTFLIITFLIVINMYIAVILENYKEASNDAEIGIVEEDLEMFYIRWSKFDPLASQFIKFDHLSEFLASLDTPFDLPAPNLVAIVAFNLPIARGNKIHCLDILHALVKHVLGAVEDSEEFRKVQEQMEYKFRRQFPSRKLLDIVSSTRVWKIQHNAALIIQRAFRDYLKRKYPVPEKLHSTLLLFKPIPGSIPHKMAGRVTNFLQHPGFGMRRKSLRYMLMQRRKTIIPTSDDKTIKSGGK